MAKHNTRIVIRISLEQQLWETADKLSNNIDVAEYGEARCLLTKPIERCSSINNPAFREKGVRKIGAGFKSESING